MTPPEHIALAVTAAHLVYAARPVRGRYLLLLAASIAASVFPDIDAFFGVYASADPYIGHRGMTHSFAGITAAALIFAAVSALAAGMLFFLKIKRSAENAASPLIKTFLSVFVFAMLGGLTHCIADLPQPAGPWKGIPLLFPFVSHGTYARFGGWGYIGWFDVRLLWLFSAAACGTMIGILLMSVTRKSVRISALFRILTISAAAGSLLWGTMIVSSSRFKNDAAWQSFQRACITSAPEPVRTITFAGLRAGYDIFTSSRKKLSR